MGLNNIMIAFGTNYDLLSGLNFDWSHILQCMSILLKDKSALRWPMNMGW
jgi:hypothetical protein